MSGLDHGVGYPLLLLCHAKAPNCRKNKAFNGLDHYSGWQKVAEAVIEAPCHIMEMLLVINVQAVTTALPDSRRRG